MYEWITDLWEDLVVDWVIEPIAEWWAALWLRRRLRSAGKAFECSQGWDILTALRGPDSTEWIRVSGIDWEKLPAYLLVSGGPGQAVYPGVMKNVYTSWIRRWLKDPGAAVEFTAQELLNEVIYLYRTVGSGSSQIHYLSHLNAAFARIIELER
jgi:hypothetical protein